MMDHESRPIRVRLIGESDPMVGKPCVSDFALDHKATPASGRSRKCAGDWRRLSPASSFTILASAKYRQRYAPRSTSFAFRRGDEELRGPGNDIVNSAPPCFASSTDTLPLRVPSSPRLSQNQGPRHHPGPSQSLRHPNGAGSRKTEKGVGNYLRAARKIFVCVGFLARTDRDPAGDFHTTRQWVGGDVSARPFLFG